MISKLIIGDVLLLEQVPVIASVKIPIGIYIFMLLRENGYESNVFNDWI